MVSDVTLHEPVEGFVVMIQRYPPPFQLTHASTSSVLLLQGFADLATVSAMSSLGVSPTIGKYLIFVAPATFFESLGSATRVGEAAGVEVVGSGVTVSGVAVTVGKAVGATVGVGSGVVTGSVSGTGAGV